MGKDMPQGVKTVSDEEILKEIEQYSDPFVKSKEVAEMFDHTRQWAHDRLQELHEQGEVEKKGGGRSVIWWPDE
jgi:predicted transcriptional regulator